MAQVKTSGAVAQSPTALADRPKRPRLAQADAAARQGAAAALEAQRRLREGDRESR
jgi:hypothetical protein